MRRSAALTRHILRRPVSAYSGHVSPVPCYASCMGEPKRKPLEASEAQNAADNPIVRTLDSLTPEEAKLLDAMAQLDRQLGEPKQPE